MATDGCFVGFWKLCYLTGVVNFHMSRRCDSTTNQKTWGSGDQDNHTHRIHVWYCIYIYANIGGILMVNVTIYTIHGSYGI